MGLGRWFSSFPFSFLNTGFLCVALPARVNGVLHHRRPASHTLLEEDRVSSYIGWFTAACHSSSRSVLTHTGIHTYIEVNPGAGEIVQW